MARYAVGSLTTVAPGVAMLKLCRYVDEDGCVPAGAGIIGAYNVGCDCSAFWRAHSSLSAFEGRPRFRPVKDLPLADPLRGLVDLAGSIVADTGGLEIAGDCPTRLEDGRGWILTGWVCD